MAIVLLSSAVLKTSHELDQCAKIKITKNVLISLENYFNSRSELTKQNLIISALFELMDQLDCEHAEDKQILAMYKAVTPIFYPGPSYGGSIHKDLETLYKGLINGEIEINSLSDYLLFEKFKNGEEVGFEEFNSSTFQQQFLQYKLGANDSRELSLEEIQMLSSKLLQNAKMLESKSEKIIINLEPEERETTLKFEKMKTQKIKLPVFIEIEEGNF